MTMQLPLTPYVPITPDEYIEMMIAAAELHPDGIPVDRAVLDRPHPNGQMLRDVLHLCAHLGERYRGDGHGAEYVNTVLDLGMFMVLRLNREAHGLPPSRSGPPDLHVWKEG